MYLRKTSSYSEFTRKLKVWHHNVRGTYSVQSMLLKLAGESQVDIVAVVEACSKTGTPPNPVPSYGYKLAFEFQGTNRVAFYIRRELGSWRATRCFDFKATVTVETEFDIVHFHEFYIPPNKISSWCIDDIAETLNAQGSHVIMGDFNLHHPWWGGDDIPRSRVRSLAKQICEQLKGDGFILANEPGKFTWERKRNGQIEQSIIDLMFVSGGESDYPKSLRETAKN